MTYERIVLVLPCCIGDVVLGTAALAALRRAYPQAHIAWAVGAWSKPAIEHHPLLNHVIDTGAAALPVKRPLDAWRFVHALRAGKFDLVVSLVRSPLMSAALLATGIPERAGLDSAGRGFGYTIKAPVDPAARRHEAEIYLDVVRALGIDTAGCYANVGVSERDQAAVAAKLAALGVHGGYLVVNPAGGRNPGMVMDSKRYPPAQLAALTNRLAQRLGTPVVVIGSKEDAPLIEAVQAGLNQPALMYAGALSFGEIGALARGARLYIGNDTGLTHYAAAAGARAVMIMGPTDPARYAPYTPTSLALWKPVDLPSGGVAVGVPRDWDWARDGIRVDDAEAQITAWLGAT